LTEPNAPQLSPWERAVSGAGPGQPLQNFFLGVIATTTVVIMACVLWQLISPIVSPPQWEYAIEAPADEELSQRLRFLGAAGWEIVTARRATSQSKSGESKAAYEMILKRPAHAPPATGGLPPLPSAPR
jgi:hypothetical protein